ncbi:PEP-CTERM/exosortase system-associated acyltransferase [Pelotalea chapellei]|uniref:PEP-CTERM/exosortase system-associated acyltransferase n=1 Tax=Pelotalea chapellei TaxID=44671 RepID=A0ABS5U5I2_9BACT|nr:PEP-CTERM/exosortase system-associated acyltransferase [Pelotalea chapellei]MBT1070913.1 PEP-CTERM/exosortase system-associated acyltransferase [Pelotalea chapellei]
MFYYKRIPRTDERIHEVYMLRYKVYCDEWKFENPEDHPGGVEIDEYDEHSSHFAVIRKDSDEMIGTTRIIFCSDRGFPLEGHAEIDQGALEGIDRELVGEVSRLAVSKDYRRRYVDKVMFEFREYDENYERQTKAERRKVDQEIVLNLYSCIYRECIEKKMTHLIAVMADGLYLLLKRIGIVFSKIGPSIDYHGPRTPYICCIDTTMQHLQKKHPEIYKRFTSMEP